MIFTSDGEEGQYFLGYDQTVFRVVGSQGPITIASKQCPNAFCQNFTLRRIGLASNLNQETRKRLSHA
jgi:hypothetical protein